MKEVMLKVNCAAALRPGGGVTPAPRDARPGPIGVPTRLGDREVVDRFVVRIAGVPDEIDVGTVARKYAATADCSQFLRGSQRYEYAYAELGRGRIVK